MVSGGQSFEQWASRLSTLHTLYPPLDAAAMWLRPVQATKSPPHGKDTSPGALRKGVHEIEIQTEESYDPQAVIMQSPSAGGSPSRWGSPPAGARFTTRGGIRSNTTLELSFVDEDAGSDAGEFGVCEDDDGAAMTDVDRLLDEPNASAFVGSDMYHQQLLLGSGGADGDWVATNGAAFGVVRIVTIEDVVEL